MIKAKRKVAKLSPVDMSDDKNASQNTYGFKSKFENGVINDINETGNAKKQKTISIQAQKKTFKQPTVEEMNQLQETQNLFHSNLFRLQIDEMLKEIKVKEKYTCFVQTWLEKFTEFVKNLKSSGVEQESSNISWLKKTNVCSPLDISNLNSKNFNFQFLKPISNPFFVGSFQIGTMIESKLIVDVCVLMPSDSFQKENHLNMIYDQKRALYLTYLAWNMSKSFDHPGCKLNFNYYQNNPYKPILEVIPNGDMGDKITIRVFIAAEENSFKLNRFVPWNSNIRSNMFKSNSKKTEEDLPLSTPNYNASVLFDLTMHRNQLILNEVIGANKNLQKGLILLKIWLRQRELGASYSGFSSYIMTMYVVYLFRQRKLNSSMSSYQVARNVWNLLASTVWNEDNKGISLCTNSSVPNLPTLEQFHANYDVVFVDSTGFLNLCSNLSLDLYFKIKYEARRAVQLLNSADVNSFQALFMTRCPVYAQFDHIFYVSQDVVIDRVLKTFGIQADKINNAGYWYPQLLKMISTTLRKGLGDRVFSLIPIENRQTTSHNIFELSRKIPKSIMFGLILNPKKAFEVLDKGPQANDDASEKFRLFWGDKSELRRFQDGSITEACVWSTAAAPLNEKRLISEKIIRYLLQHHFNILPSEIEYIASEFDVAYMINNVNCNSENHKENAESTALEVIKTFDDLAKQLRSINGLPLDITDIQGVSPVFRYCDPSPILPRARCINDLFHSHQVCEGVIQLGLSGKWPNKLSAFCALKTAFYLQIGKALLMQYKLRSRTSVEGIEVLKKGYVFRLKIAHPKEISLLRKETIENGFAKYKDSKESIDFEKKNIIIPVITSILHGLYQRFPCFGPTAMIAKRWLFSQLLDEVLWPIECTELLVASLFINSGALSNASQPQTTFFRFLLMLANTDWHSEMVKINFGGDMNDTIYDLETRFIKERDTFPPLFIVTSCDLKQRAIWTRDGPSLQVLARVRLLAQHAINIIETCLYDGAGLLSPSTLFTPNLDGYDVVINLKKSLVSNCNVFDWELNKNFKNKNQKLLPPLTSFLPVQRGLQELREAFSEYCIFFYNPCGGTEIAVIWKPEVFADKQFKVTSVTGCSVIGNNQIQCKLNIFIEDFKIILKDIFTSIENKKTP